MASCSPLTPRQAGLGARPADMSQLWHDTDDGAAASEAQPSKPLPSMGAAGLLVTQPFWQRKPWTTGAASVHSGVLNLGRPS